MHAIMLGDMLRHFIEASVSGDVKLLEQLLDHVDVAWRDPESGRGLLHHACEHDKPKVVRLV